MPDRTRIVERFEHRVGLRGRARGPAAARHEIGFFLRRIALLMTAVAVLVSAEAAALAAFEDVSYWQGRDVVARHRQHDRRVRRAP